MVSVSTMTYCVVQINCLPLPRFLKEVAIKTAEGRYEETWNSYLELLNKDPRASLKALLVQKGEEEEKTKRALKVLGKLNRNKSEKQTPPAQETETPATTIIQQRKSLMAKRRDRTPTTAPSARFTTISRQ